MSNYILRRASAELPSHLTARTRLSTGKQRLFSSTAQREADFTHAVIGGGAVGLAIARRLQQHGNGVSTVLIEKHGAVGTETSSRNSEVNTLMFLSYTFIQLLIGVCFDMATLLLCILRV